MAVEYLRAAIDHDVDPAAVVALGERLAADTAGDPQIALDIEKAALFVRPLPESLVRIQALAADHGLPSNLEVQVALLRCTAQSHHGDLQEARSAAERLLATGDLDRVTRSRCQSVVVESAAWLGDIDAALGRAGSELAVARNVGDLDHELLMRHVAQVSLTLAGRIAEAVAHGRRNAQLLSLRLGLRVAPSVYDQLALSLSELRGGRAEAARMRELARNLPASSQYVWRTDGLLAASRLAASASEREELLEQAAEAARQRGCRIHLARVLHERIRRGIGDPAATELADVARHVGGVTGLWARHATAHRSADHAELSALSLDAEGTGMLRLAAECAAGAATIAMDDAGGAGVATVLVERFHRLVGRIPGTVLAVDAPPSPITVREREAIAAVMDGSTDAAIAADWRVSVRTVHGHLHRAYRKLDVGGREELAALRDRLDPRS